MDLRQSLRWAIPGWLFILFVAIFHAIQYAGPKDGLTWTTIVKPLTENGLSPLQVVLALLAAGLPWGYLMAQLYWFHFWNRWDLVPVGVFIRRIKLWKCSCPVPWLRVTSPVPYDRGYLILKDADIDFESLVGRKLDDISKGRSIWPRGGFRVIGVGYFLDKPDDLIERYKRNWFLAQFAWHHTLSARGLEFLDKHAQFLGDIYHSLGATRTALLYAFGFFAALLPLENGLGLDLLRWSSYLGLCRIRVLWNVGFLVVMYLVLSHAREVVLESLIALQHDVITPLATLPRTGTRRMVDGIYLMKNSA